MAAGNMPRPARKMGTSTGRLASCTPSVVASGVVTLRGLVGIRRVASATTTSDSLRISARKIWLVVFWSRRLVSASWATG